MTEGDFRRGYFGVAMSLVLFHASQEAEKMGHIGVQVFLVLAALAFSLAGCAIYARAKGLSRGHLFFGLIPIFGFWALLCIEGSASQSGELPAESEPTS